MAAPRRFNRRHLLYLVLRGTAALTFVLSALLLHGAGAGVLCIAAGVVAVLTCLGVNAGGPGELAGARAQQRALDRIRPPQGDWPPYPAERVLDGEAFQREP